jgi:hypothetical protein
MTTATTTSEGNDHRNNRSQQDYSGSPDDLVVAIEHPPRGKKSGTTQEQFDKLLHKQCPVSDPGPWDCVHNVV